MLAQSNPMMCPWCFHGSGVVASIRWCMSFHNSHGASIGLPWATHGVSEGLSLGFHNAFTIWSWQLTVVVKISWCFHYASMLVLRDFHGSTFSVPRWCSHGASMVLPWFFHGQSHGVPCRVHGVSMVLLWYFQETRVMFPGNTRDVSIA